MTKLETPQNISTIALKGTQKRFISSTPSSNSFEEVYKTSYSHGLEAIYTLENVDIKSVRKIESPSKPIPKKPENRKDSSRPLQNELDLGEEYRGWMSSFVKKEPIQVLELSKYAEKSLMDNGKCKIEDLLGVKLKDFVFLRGMGQGHLEEIQQKLNDYVEGHQLERCPRVDFASWLKGLVALHDRKKVFVFLEAYQLSDLFSLTPGEHVEVKKLTLEKKQEWVEELLSKIANPVQKNLVLADLQRIFKVFFTPWIRERGGFASKEELKERMQRISINSVISTQVLRILETIYFENGTLYSSNLQEIDQGIYCSDSHHARDYKMVVNKAMSYFYKSSVYYPLHDLVGMMEREFGKQWIGFPNHLIEKILRISPAFRIVKGSLGFLEIRANYR